MGILEQIQETLDILVEKFDKIEKKLDGIVPSKDPNEIMDVKQICEEMKISRSEFQRHYSQLPIFFRMKNGGHLKCLRKNFENYLNDQLGNG